MEAAAGVVASRGGSLPMSSSRKEWRAVSDHHSVGTAGDEELDRPNLGQSDERTIYEVQRAREPADVDFCSINVNGSLDNDIMQQRIHSITRQREELQHVEIELKAQLISRSEILEMQHSFDAQIKEHKDAAAKLKEQLHEREQAIHELERGMEEKDRELHAIKLDNEAAWAKEDLLREQNKELATFRRERDHSEAERAQHIQQIRDLQELIQEKERQILELQEQHRVDQETIFLKDEQLKVWIARVQEMDALQSTLQVELRERTEQYNQLWMGCQRQLAEMERLHLHTVQQLHLELADARERSGPYTEESRISQTNSKDMSKFGQSNGNQLDVNANGATSANDGPLPNGNADNASNQTNHVAGVPIAPSSLLGMPTYLPPGQVTALHPFILHQQGIPHSMPSHVPQSHVGHFHSIPAMSSLPQWQNQQVASEGAQLSTQNPPTSSQPDHNLMGSDAKYEYEMSVNGQGFRPGYVDVHNSQVTEPDPVISSSTGEAQVLESRDRSYMVASQPEQRLQQISSQFNDSLRLNTLDKNSEAKEQNVFSDQDLDGQVSTEEQPSPASASLSETSMHSVNVGEATINNGTVVGLSESLISTGQANVVTVGKTSETSLLDERSLLACIVRTIPAGGRIRINSTLPNRLGKMLAPLHWHDYKKKYGKLDEFVAGHPELFFIEGDYIQLREGAQEMIAATAAVAKVAAAAAASHPYSSFLPSVAVTPMAQSHRLKKVPSIDSKQLNGVSFGNAGGVSNVKILSKPKESQEMNGPDFDRSSISSNQSKGSLHGRSNLNFAGKQQGRTTGAALTSGR
ncbi:uncharacterized protein LOC110625778 isoform X2 [Manihot esculenta]|uniref:DUF7725 domain-containing protein n=1 Tax=Manihot esculenta TaxID=3983 RepID=A0A2C9WHK3_MANES|nr:uncharacterized protein LOC110625778 isoform X2 [Manihot esculenta]OAY59564.1 hypothetical protein MANES_01G041300v8 [Manihot esculenta]